jgi:hypothetical protein
MGKSWGWCSSSLQRPKGSGSLFLVNRLQEHDTTAFRPATHPHGDLADRIQGNMLAAMRFLRYRRAVFGLFSTNGIRRRWCKREGYEIERTVSFAFCQSFWSSSRFVARKRLYLGSTAANARRYVSRNRVRFLYTASLALSLSLRGRLQSNGTNYCKSRL